MILPSPVTSGSLQGFFLSYAVAMAPPSVVSPEVFRKIVAGESGTMYGALITDTYRRLAIAADEASEVQHALNYEPEAAHVAFSKLADTVRAALLDAVRLADFWKTDVVREGLIKSPWGVKWPTLAHDTLTHRATADELSKIGDHLRNSALLPWLEQRAILTRTYRNIWHGGMIDDLGHAIGDLGRLRATGNIQPERLCSIEARLREIQEHYKLLAKRAGWMYEPKNGCDLEKCRELYARAVVSVVGRYTKEYPNTLKVLRACAPYWLQVTGEFSLHEEILAVYEVFSLLLGNIVKHELRSRDTQDLPADEMVDADGWLRFCDQARSSGLAEEEIEGLQKLLELQASSRSLASSENVPWGISLCWVPAKELNRDQENQSSLLPPAICEAYQRWKSELKESNGAALIRAYPFTGDPNEFGRKLAQGGEHRQGAPSGLGLLALTTLTRVYCQESSENRAVCDPLPTVGAIASEKGGVYVLIPGNERNGQR